jgi:hypothetical protein
MNRVYARTPKKQEREIDRKWNHDKEILIQILCSITVIEYEALFCCHRGAEGAAMAGGKGLRPCSPLNNE